MIAVYLATKYYS